MQGPAINTFEFKSLPSALLEELTALLGARFSSSASVREHHGSDISALDPMPPQAVAFVNSLAEIVSVQKACHTHRCLLYTSPSPRDRQKSRMPSSA